MIGSFDTKQVIITQNHIQIGNSFMQRRPFPEIVGRRSSKQGLRLLHHHIEPLSSLIKSVNMKWMTILVSLFFLKAHRVEGVQNTLDHVYPYYFAHPPSINFVSSQSLLLSMTLHNTLDFSVELIINIKNLL